MLTFYRGRWSASWLLTLLTVVAVVCFVQLGRWQWHRAEGKRALAAAFTAGNAAAQELGDRGTAALPVPGISLVPPPPPAGLQWPKLTSFPTTSDLSSALGQPLEAQQLLLNAD